MSPRFVNASGSIDPGTGGWVPTRRSTGPGVGPGPFSQTAPDQTEVTPVRPMVHGSPRKTVAGTQASLANAPMVDASGRVRPGAVTETTRRPIGAASTTVPAGRRG